MAPNRLMRGRRVRRALSLGAAALLVAGALGACGGGGSTDTSEVDQEADVGVLNELLARQLAAAQAYGQVLPALHGADLRMARQFRAQEQEHVDSMTKTLRGIGGEPDPPEETIEADELKTRADNLEFLYEMESKTIDAELSAVDRLTTEWPRPLIASMAANQAQRLVLLRRGLGASPLEAIPSAFENGEIPAPERTAAK
ncbi:MAG TPA: ferritin-like domain-containing protein [Solirubrobacterales bacterium]|nr:ferritin-like domain-containing protein [Solirubrobacterales bacterium]